MIIKMPKESTKTLKNNQRQKYMKTPLLLTEILNPCLKTYIHLKIIQEIHSQQN